MSTITADELPDEDDPHDRWEKFIAWIDKQLEESAVA